MSEIPRCDDCGFPLRIHFGPGGKPLGCPAGVSAQLGRQDALPRVTIRLGKSGVYRGRLLAAWPDCLDRTTTQVLVWDLGSGDQFLAHQRELQRGTSRPTKDQEYAAIEEVEYQLGSKVRAIPYVSPRTSEG